MKNHKYFESEVVMNFARSVGTSALQNLYPKEFCHGFDPHKGKVGK